MNKEDYGTIDELDEPFIDPAYDEYEYLAPNYNSKKKKKGSSAAKVFSAIICALYFIGFCLPYFFSFSNGIVNGNILVGATGKSLVQLLLNIFITGSLTGNGSYDCTVGLYILVMTVMFIGVLVAAIGALSSTKNSNVWGYFCGGFAVLGAIGYGAFSFDLTKFDFIELAALIGTIVLIFEALYLAKRAAILPLISLIALGLFMVLTYESPVSVSRAFEHFFYLITGTADNYPAEEFQPCLIVSYATAVTVYFNIVCSIIQIPGVKRTTPFTVIRYAITCLLAVISFFSILAVIQDGTFPFSVLIILVISAALTIASAMALFSNHNTLHPITDEDGDDAAKAERNTNKVNNAQTQNPNYSPANASPNIFIFGDPKSASGMDGASSILKMFSPSRQCDGFVGSVNVVNNTPAPEKLPEPEIKKPLDGIFTIVAGAAAILAILSIIISTAFGSQHFVNGPAAFVSIVLILLLGVSVGFSILTYLFSEKLYSIALSIGSGISLFLYFVFEIAFAGGVSIFSLPVMLFILTSLVCGLVATYTMQKKGVSFLYMRQGIPFSRFDQPDTDEAAPYRYMGESVSNEEPSEQEDLPNMAAPEVEETESTELLTSSSLDEATAFTEELALPAAEEEIAVTETVVYGDDFIEEPVEELVDDVEEDDFLQLLSAADRAEFRRVFLCEEALEFLPEYVIGGDNSEFFNNAFIYLSKTRESISDSLLEAMYSYINS